MKIPSLLGVGCRDDLNLRNKMSRLSSLAQMRTSSIWMRTPRTSCWEMSTSMSKISSPCSSTCKKLRKLSQTRQLDRLRKWRIFLRFGVMIITLTMRRSPKTLRSSVMKLQNWWCVSPSSAKTKKASAWLPRLNWTPKNIRPSLQWSTRVQRSARKSSKMAHQFHQKQRSKWAARSTSMGQSRTKKVRSSTP